MLSTAHLQPFVGALQCSILLAYCHSQTEGLGIQYFENQLDLQASLEDDMAL